MIEIQEIVKKPEMLIINMGHRKIKKEALERQGPFLSALDRFELFRARKGKTTKKLRKRFSVGKHPGEYPIDRFKGRLPAQEGKLVTHLGPFLAQYQIPASDFCKLFNEKSIVFPIGFPAPFYIFRGKRSFDIIMKKLPFIVYLQILLQLKKTMSIYTFMQHGVTFFDKERTILTLRNATNGFAGILRTLCKTTLFRLVPYYTSLELTPQEEFEVCESEED